MLHVTSRTGTARLLAILQHESQLVQSTLLYYACPFASYPISRHLSTDLIMDHHETANDLLRRPPRVHHVWYMEHHTRVISHFNNARLSVGFLKP